MFPKSKISGNFPFSQHYKHIRSLFIYLSGLYACFSTLQAQNVTIRGQAHPDYNGKIIQLLTASDYITGIRQKETQDTIQPDGVFELSFQSDFTQPVFFEIGNVVASLYVQPERTYDITVPPIDKAFDYNNGAELFVNIGVFGNDSTELNALIFDYEGLYNDYFAPEDNRFLSRAVMFRRADSLKRTCEKRYKDIRNDWFKNYVNYSIASVNASVSRGENFLIGGIIIGHPILYRHSEYMNFFNSCFSGYLKTLASSRKGQSLYNIVNTEANYKLLDAFVKEDGFMKGDTLRELVILKNLWQFYYSSEFDQMQVASLINQLNAATVIEEHRRIAGRMLTYINKMQTGAEAPGFVARSKEGTMGSLASYKNHWVYLNFFSTTNTASLREMPKIAALKKKFGDKISFISICVDDSLKSYTNFVKVNPRYDWPIWYNNDKSIQRTAKEIYFVSGTEAYFLINNQGYLAQSPALSPSQGIEYKFNTLFKTKRRTTKTGIR